MKNIRFIIVFLLSFTCMFSSIAQVSTFNQYNASFSTINPSFTSSIDKNGLSIISRLQWRKNYLGSLNNQISFNYFMPRINSSIGAFSNYTSNLKDTFSQLTNGLNYSYRVIFLGSYYLCTGLNVKHNINQLDITNYDYMYKPKYNYIKKQSNVIETQYMDADFGLAFHNPEKMSYVGFSLNNIPIYNIANNSSYILQQKTFSFQSLFFLPISRKSGAFTYTQYNYGGKLTHYFIDTESTLQKNQHYFHIQENIMFSKYFVFGMGYKRFLKNYGVFNYRATISIQKLSFGYSFDTKPYIKHDKIRYNSSHEISLRYRFNEH